MLSTTRSAPVHSPAPGIIPETATGPASNGSPIATGPDPGIAPAQPSPAVATGPDPGIAAAQPSPVTDRETPRERFRRTAHRSRLHAYAILAVALGVFLIALAVSNTAQVKINWVFGSSQVSLVWLVLFAAILGWLVGLVVNAAFHWRTRAPRRQQGRPIVTRWWDKRRSLSDETVSR